MEVQEDFTANTKERLNTLNSVSFVILHKTQYWKKEQFRCDMWLVFIVIYSIG